MLAVTPLLAYQPYPWTLTAFPVPPVYLEEGVVVEEEGVVSSPQPHPTV